MFEYSARPDLLKDRVILVTGAGRGIGEAAAKAYAAHGATVLLLGKGHEKTIERANGENPWDEIATAKAAIRELLVNGRKDDAAS